VCPGQACGRILGRLFNVEVTWFDGELSDAKQLAAIEDMANQKWDLVAIQPYSIDTLTAPVEKMIKAGIPVIGLDTLIAPLDKVDCTASSLPTTSSWAQP
jgi:ribose transport system substrate-binding protein